MNPVSKRGFAADLHKNDANYTALTPLNFLRRAAEIHPDHIAVIDGEQRYDYRQFYARCRCLADVLTQQGCSTGDVVAVLASNSPALLEAHYGIPFFGGVVNPLNTRLDAAALAFILDHSGSRVLIFESAFDALITAILPRLKKRPHLIRVADGAPPIPALSTAADYETALSNANAKFAWSPPADEWDAISLNYTSGTTGDPKGVVYHHRGAALLAMGNLLVGAIPHHPVYLWTLPMFHCNGWCFTWSLSLLAGTHICLRKITAEAIFDACIRHKVTHLCGAPTIMAMLINAPTATRPHFDRPIDFYTAAAPPPPSTLTAMEAIGFTVTHLYGLTETYGPAVVNEWKQPWNAYDPDHQATLKARQGVAYPVLDALAVKDTATMNDVPRDGTTVGEIMFRGNIVMKGYYNNPEATAKAFSGGWFHSGDLAIHHPDGYVQIVDRNKDIIISGGENISSIEVENRLCKHPSVLEAAVVARADSFWGEVPCAFVSLRDDAAAISEGELIDFCRDGLAHFKCPKQILFGALPKTSTGKIRKFVLRQRLQEL